MGRYQKEPVEGERGAGIDKFYIVDSEQQVNGKPGIIARTHSENNANRIVNAMNYYNRVWDTNPEVEKPND